jgi:hypothetical protein
MDATLPRSHAAEVQSNVIEESFAACTEKRGRCTYLVHSLTAMSLALLTAACAPLPPEGTGEQGRRVAAIRAESRASPNFDERRPNFVVIHHTSSNNIDRSLQVLTEAASRVSAHYLIGRDGRIYHLVDERRRAWHAGESYWGGQRDLNSASIGIELDNNGNEAFPEPQITALLALLGDLRVYYKIPPENFLAEGGSERALPLASTGGTGFRRLVRPALSLGSERLRYDDDAAGPRL